MYWILRSILTQFLLVYNQLSIEGRENLEKQTPYIFAANHCSAIDILIMIAAIKKPIFIPYKTGFFPKPIEMLLFNIVPGAPIKNNTLCKNSFKTIIRHIKDGRSLIISPEGTRSSDGTLQAFKDGASLIAYKTGVPVVPVALIDTNKALPLGKILLRPRKIKIIIGAPIHSDFSSRSKNDIHEYTIATRDSIVSLLEKEAAQN